nr:monocarboxylate transporter 13-like isoform X2 [Crassostrea virginica]XP_022341515.1 monocarboxylate transporter 13-like isoform X2 [Crassostrea virginica]
MKYFSSRQCVVIGGFIVTLSLILSTFAQCVLHLIFTHSVLMGIGLAAVLGPSLIITGQYFDVRRGMANGLHTAAASLGALVLAPFFTYCTDNFLLKGALLIMAGLAFHIVPAGMLLRPPQLYEKWAHRRRKLNKSHDLDPTQTVLLMEESENGLIGGASVVVASDHASLFKSSKPKDALSVHSYDIPRLSNGNKFHSNGNIHDQRLSLKDKVYGSADVVMVLQYGKGSMYSLVNGQKSNSLHLNGTHSNGSLTNGCADHEIPRPAENTKGKTSVRNFFNVSIFQKSSYLFFAIGFTMGVPVVITVVYLPDVAKDCGIPSDDAALLVSIYMVGEIIGRCGSGFFSGKLIHRQVVIACGLFIAGVAQNLVRFLQSFWYLAIFAIVNGVFGGPIHGLYASVVADMLGIENLRSGLCVLQLSQGLIWSAILPVTGYLRDVSGDYMLTYHFVGSLTICASFVLLISHYKLKDVSATVIEVDIEEIDETD